MWSNRWGAEILHLGPSGEVSQSAQHRFQKNTVQISGYHSINASKSVWGSWGGAAGPLQGHLPGRFHGAHAWFNTATLSCSPGPAASQPGSGRLLRLESSTSPSCSQALWLKPAPHGSKVRGQPPATWPLEGGLGEMLSNNSHPQLLSINTLNVRVSELQDPCPHLRFAVLHGGLTPYFGMWYPVSFGASVKHNKQSPVISIDSVPAPMVITV